MDGVTLALDVGGTKIAGALVDGALQIRYAAQIATPQSRSGADPGLGATLALATELLGHVASQGWRVVGVGAGFPEYVDQSGHVTSREVLDWGSVQPKSVLAAACGGVPCVVESDVRCGAVAEWRCGAGRDRPGMFYVSLGTGLSAVSIVDGQVIRGERGEAIALGEWDVGDGNLESYASGAGIAGRYPDDVDTQEIVRRAYAGDAPARHVLTTAGEALGSALADVVSLLDPPIIVLGGGLGCAETPLHQSLRATYDERVARRPSPPPLVRAELGSRAGVLGAALVGAPR